MNKWLFLFLFFPFLFGCSSEDEGDIPAPNFVLDLQVQALLQDAEGNDLFDPSAEGYVNPDSIRIYSVVDGEKELVMLPDDSCSVRAGEAYDGSRFVFLYLATRIVDKSSLDYIQWTPDWVDTVRCTITDKNTIIKDIYVNGRRIEPGTSAVSDRTVLFTRPD